MKGKLTVPATHIMKSLATYLGVRGMVKSMPVRDVVAYSMRSLMFAANCVRWRDLHRGLG